MAGNYPDVPSWRMAYDRDGTQMFSQNGAIVTQRTSAEMVILNTDNAFQSGVSGPASWWPDNTVFIFPELRDVDAAYVYTAWTSSAMQMWTSVDTTNGVDGTWVSQGTIANGRDNPVAHRTAITSKTILAVRAVKIQGQNWYHRMHLYGEPAPGENPDRLELWHPTLNQRVGPAYFDWGDVPRGSTADRTFRVKNLSSTLTASSIRVAMESNADTTPSVPGQHTLSADGTTFLAQVNIGNLAAGAISSTITLRRVTPTNAVLSLWQFRLFAEANSWA